MDFGSIFPDSTTAGREAKVFMAQLGKETSFLVNAGINADLAYQQTQHFIIGLIGLALFVGQHNQSRRGERAMVRRGLRLMEDNQVDYRHIEHGAALAFAFELSTQEPEMRAEVRIGNVLTKEGAVDKYWHIASCAAGWLIRRLG